MYIILHDIFQAQSEEAGNSSSEDSGHCSPEPENEFLKVHAQLRGGRTSTALS
jgi:hypothetical protein